MLSCNVAISLCCAGAGVQGAEASWELVTATSPAANDAVKRFPHLFGTTALVVPPEAVERISELVTGQLLVSMHDATGVALDATGLQVGSQFVRPFRVFSGL